jgi:hypothetical protein
MRNTDISKRATGQYAGIQSVSVAKKRANKSKRRNGALVVDKPVAANH